ncbi:MAG TPA: Gfo/Idh/MocA family oxidoreductase [Candidatus Paceibacterota bacterium]|nr:Gfo/Idh/MocA family oxidoreductase [Verrucomicrobiota bacterium]HSA11878.1 Gfo/Idh/MocA family oxidoreductase [Candidatus Paceibacterota bacterium]
MNELASSSKISRRRFLAAASLAVAAPTIIPASVLGRAGNTAPSGRITMGIVGWGMMGPGNTDAFLGMNDVQVVAACDLDKNHLQGALDRVNGHYKNKDCKPYHDYRDMMDRKDIDAVMLAVPDHWHALLAIDAAKNKKDIYGEKPLARTVAEQQAIVKAVQKHKRIWQTGSWQRSQAPFRKAAEIVRNGLIGKVTRVEVGLPSGHSDFAGTKDKMGVTQPPAWLDYPFWIGPSRMEPYIEGRVHMNWRWNYNTGGGQLLDWVGHHCDIAHWGLAFDNSGPYEIEGHGEFPPPTAVWHTCTKYRITLKYPNDITMIMAGGHADIRGGTKWIGTEGWVWVDRGGFDASNPDWFAQIPPDRYKIVLYKSDNHHRNFIDCVKSRQPTITPVETAHHSALPGHLGLISMLVGRKIKWDADKERILDDAEAAKLLTRPYRSPWKLR